MENKITKAVTLTEIVALTLLTGFIGYRAYQIFTDKPYKFKQENSITNSPYLNSIYDSKEKLR